MSASPVHFLLLMALVGVSSITYDVVGPSLLRNGHRWAPVGVNAMSLYGSADGRVYPSNASIVREYVIMGKQPIHCHETGCWAKQLSTGSWLHPLEPLLQKNFEGGVVTIIDLHRWNESSGMEFWGVIPSQTSYYSEYLHVLLEKYVPLCKGRPDRWLSIWNEPFMWDGSDNVTGTKWAYEMGEILRRVRDAGLENVVVVPGGKMGQDESVVVSHGAQLAALYGPIVFDVHAYQRWTAHPAEQIRSRLGALRAAGVAFLFGEVGPSNAGEKHDPWPFLDELTSAHVGVTAWCWKCATTSRDYNALRGPCVGDDGVLNDHENFNWGPRFVEYISARFADSMHLAQDHNRGASNITDPSKSRARVVVEHGGIISVQHGGALSLE